MSSHRQGDADIGFRNLLAHVVSVSIKPLPYKGAGPAGGIAVEVLGNPEGGGARRDCSGGRSSLCDAARLRREAPSEGTPDV